MRKTSTSTTLSVVNLNQCLSCQEISTITYVCYTLVHKCKKCTLLHFYKLANRIKQSEQSAFTHIRDNVSHENLLRAKKLQCTLAIFAVDIHMLIIKLTQARNLLYNPKIKLHKKLYVVRLLFVIFSILKIRSQFW